MFIIFVATFFSISRSLAQQQYNAAAIVTFPLNFEGDNSTVHLSPVFFEKPVYTHIKHDDFFKNQFHEHSTFEASEEWQEYPEDDIPSWVDIRININTMERMFMPAADQTNGSSAFSTPKMLIDTDGNPEFSFEDLKKALKSFKKVDAEKKKKKARQEEFIVFSKESLKRMLMNYTTSELKIKMAILKELENLVHQYNVATDFVKIGGVHILLPDLLSGNPDVQAFIALVLGSAMQGKPPVQQAVFKTEAMLQLLLAVHSANSSEVKSRSLYALSNLIRHYPDAQLNIVKLGGFFVLSELFHPGSPLRLKLKVVDLLYDLVAERQHVDDENDENDLRREGSYHRRDSVTSNE